MRSSTATMTQARSLIAYTIGLGLPFLAIALVYDRAPALLRPLVRHGRPSRSSWRLVVLIGLAMLFDCGAPAAVLPVQHEDLSRRGRRPHSASPGAARPDRAVRGASSSSGRCDRRGRDLLVIVTTLRTVAGGAGRSPADPVRPRTKPTTGSGPATSTRVHDHRRERSPVALTDLDGNPVRWPLGRPSGSLLGFVCPRAVGDADLRPRGSLPRSRPRRRDQRPGIEPANVATTRVLSAGYTIATDSTGNLGRGSCTACRRILHRAGGAIRSVVPGPDRARASPDRGDPARRHHRRAAASSPSSPSRRGRI